jgi:hypothetical protein
MEKFHHIAGAPGLAALKAAVLNEEVATGAAESGHDLFAFLNTSSSMASSLVSSAYVCLLQVHLRPTLNLTTFRHSSNTMVVDKDKAERHERLQAFLARRSSWLDMTMHKPNTLCQSMPSDSTCALTSTQFLPLLSDDALVACI